MHKIFIIIIVAVVLLGGSALIYIWSRFRRFEWLPQETWKRNLLAALPTAVLLICWILSLNVLVAIIHLAVIWFICDSLAVVFRKKRTRRYYAGYVAIAFTTLCLTYGYISCHRVTETHYTLHTQKALRRGHFRIALISDVHLGTTFGGEKLSEYLAKIAEKKPDVLMIAGDLADDDTKQKDWQTAVEALSNFHAPLGKYFTFGNHDKGYYRHRDFSAEELVRNLEYAEVQVLQDKIISLTPCIDLIGRKDRSAVDRRTAAELMASCDASHYHIMMDHQPTDYDAEAAAGTDLVLSGHTHGGQLWPFAYLVCRAVNDNVYGLVHRDMTDFVVSSGMSDWAISFKTGCKSEFVIIDVYENKEAMFPKTDNYT